MINLNYGVILTGNVLYSSAYNLTGNFLTKTDLVLSGKTIMSTVNKDYSTYAGPYAVIPTTQTIALNTKKKVLEDEITIDPIPIGNAGTPSVTKGSVTDHSVTITPSVTNTTGYIDGGTIIGNDVNVTAGELVSGTLDITTNATVADVTNYEKVNVMISDLVQPEAITIVKNGVYTAPKGKAYTPVTVIIPQIDLSNDTVTPGDVLSGVTFHLSDGTQSVGTALTATATVSENTLYLTDGFPISM